VLKAQHSTKPSALRFVVPVRHAVHPVFRRPRIVFSRDESAGAGKSSDRTPTVLIVEDDYLVATQMEDALTGAGFTVTAIVASAADAIAAVAATRVDVAVMDVRLVGQRDGVDAAIELFESHGVRSVFATAHHDRETRQRAEKANPLGWVQKPYSMASLVVAVRDALGLPRH
jgi:DNA-binding NarL/FixJ family response regulator